ncbi:hypothetical protein INR49_030218 [Caranx melampygus]|nr:hypothetical protein INR49_030218 [Caranx melampygus]
MRTWRVVKDWTSQLSGIVLHLWSQSRGRKLQTVYYLSPVCLLPVSCLFPLPDLIV